MPNPDLLISEFVTKVGVARVTIDLFNPTEPNDLFDIYDIGTIDYDFDVTSYGDVLNNIGAMYNRTKLTCSLYSRANRNILDILYSYLFSGTFFLPVTISIDTYDGNSYEFSYEIRQNGLKYDENSLKLTIELDPVIPTETVGDVYNSFTSKANIGIDALNTQPAVLTGNFIEEAISNLNTNLTTIHEPAPASAVYGNYTYANNPFGDYVEGIQTYIRSAGSVTTPALEDVARFAVLGGDFYGTGFDNNFYVHRLNTNRVVQIDYDEIEALQFSFTPSPYNAISLTLDGTSPSNIVDSTTSSTGNRFAEKSISGLYTLPNYTYKAKYTSPAIFADTDYAGFGTSDIESVIIASGINAHKAALNAQASPLVRVEFVVFGMDKIKPYEAIQFIGDVPDRYKYTTGVNPRYFRPTSLSYDLMEDKVKVKAYSIS